MFLRIIVVLLILCPSLPLVGQIGIGTQSPDASALLDVESTEKGMLIPRMSEPERDAISSPAKGLMVYNTTENCLQVNTGTSSMPSWLCVGISSPSTTVVNNCNVNSFEGTYINGTALIGSEKFSVTITNNSFADADINFSTGDLVLSGVSGLSVNSVSPTSITLAPGNNQLVEYELIGTPVSSGTLQGVWTKLALTCTKTVDVVEPSMIFGLPTCGVNNFEGTYIVGVPLTGTHKFSITVTNNGGTSQDMSFTTGDLILSGISGITVSSVNPTSATLASTSSQVIEYELTGTPASSGTLTGDWTNSGVNCMANVEIAKGDAAFNLPYSVWVTSVDDTSPTVDILGVVDNATNQYVFQLPYESGTGTYDAYTGDYVINNSGTGASGDVNSFRISYPAGAFTTSGTIPVTIEVDGDGSFNATKQLFGILDTIAEFPFYINGSNKGSIFLNIVGGVPDRNFTDSVHQYVYIPITALDGNVWLNNNLGADYANLHHVEYKPEQQAITLDDTHAYGALYQWGRLSDGHELIIYSTPTTASGVYGTTTTNSTTDVPGDSLYIIETISPNDWRVPGNDLLWQGENGINNPCPEGYRLPTESEWNGLITSESIVNNTDAYNSTLKISAAGFHHRSGSFFNIGQNPSLWSSTVAGSDARGAFIGTVGTSILSFQRASGLSVRCIKD